ITYDTSTTAGFKILLKRIKHLIVHDADLPSEFKIQNDYHFLKELKIQQAIYDLSELRNNIIHNGSKILNRYVYEVFIINELLPIVKRILSLQTNKYLERKTYCGKNVLGE